MNSSIAIILGLICYSFYLFPSSDGCLIIVQNGNTTYLFGRTYIVCIISEKIWKLGFLIHKLYLGNDETFDRTAMIDWSKFNLAKQSFQTCETDGEEGLTWDEVDSCEVLY